MTRAVCPECLEPVDVPTTAREGRCLGCRPSRSHSQPRRAHWRKEADESFRQLVEQHPTH